ncbi:AAA family ATPase [Nocardia sp. NPDC058480]|uniref:helix-turn-helix transcriptional regulator n=1 Tax=Nocardia sp. NPDC058480 TaxID=3346522 RepID=UPI00365AC688
MATELIGRDGELADLLGRLDDAVHGAPQLVICSGEAGVGKTSLVAELTVRARRDGVRTLWARALELPDTPPFWLWHQALGTSTPAPGADRVALFDGFAAGLDGATGGVLLVVDDIHWADEPSLQALLYVVRALRERRIMVCATECCGTAGTGWTTIKPDLLREPVAGSLPLRGLSPTDSAHCLRIEAGRDLPDQLAGEAFDMTAGNPFYLRELGRSLRGSTDDALRLPTSLREVVRGRMTPRSASAQELLRAASILGERFTIAVAARLVERSVPDCLGAVDEAIDAGLLAAADEPGTVRFTHALVRAALLDGLSLQRRVLLHQRAALGIEELYPDAVEANSAALAWHWANAAVGGAPEPAVRWARRAADVALRELAFEEAVRLYGLALTHAADLDPVARGGLLLQRAAAAARAGVLNSAKSDFLAAQAIARAACHAGPPHRRPEAVVLLAEAALVLEPIGDRSWDRDIADACAEALAAGVRDEARAAGVRDEARAAGVRDEARAAGVRDEARAACPRDEALAARARDEALAAGARAVASAADHPPDGTPADGLSGAPPADALPESLRARLLARATEAAVHLGNLDGVDESSRAAMQSADRSDDPVVLAAALRARRLACSGPEHRDEHRVLATRMIEAGERARDPAVEMWGRLWRIDALWEQGDLSVITGELACLSWCSERTGGPMSRWRLLVAQAASAQAHAEFDDALDLAGQAHELATTLGHPAGEGAYRALLGVVGHHRGHRREVLTAAAAVTRGPVSNLLLAALGTAFPMMDSGLSAEAEPLYRNLGPPQKWSVPPYFRLNVLAVGGAIAAALRIGDDVAYFREQLGRYRGMHVTGGGNANYLGPVELWLGKFAVALGDSDVARIELAGAAQTARMIGAPGFAVEAECELAELLLLHRDTAAAVALAKRALPTAISLAMPPWTHRLRVVAAHEITCAALTPREREVADLVARGLTNHEIAAALVLSDRTAQNHVQHILTKLGFAKRSQIAAWVSSRIPQ